jgi:phenylalanine-4-hydroxylase
VQPEMESNEVLDKLPDHLRSLIIEQPYNDYTAQDHAVWRYVMRQNIRYLPAVAHHSYLEGLKRTGISIDCIPHMYGMNRILKEIGWAAVAVDGFIPPRAFMEFQAYNVLVIAADIRPIDQIEYTPAPDIIHEAAGHAPIIADSHYAEYLRMFGYIGSKAFSSALDNKIYKAIRHLSILKADPYTAPDKIKEAETELENLEHSINGLSEMSLIRNLHWWTVEYGLIGDLKNPKIYGAGLLSSIGESYSSMQPDVKKLPYSIEAVNTNFDITTRQPQLFVTPDFNHLSDVLDEFACRMAWRRGGLYGVQKAIESESTATCEYRSGLQVSGTFTHLLENDGKVVFIKTSGPTQLCFENKQIDGHGKSYHHHGFSSPVGKLAGHFSPLEKFTDAELKNMGIEVDKKSMLTFESGVEVSGKLTKIHREKGNILLMTFSDCTVKYQDQVLFEPSWGLYDMAVGESIYSAYSGPADPAAYEYMFEVPDEKTHKIAYTETAMLVHSLYSKVRVAREKNIKKDELENLFKQVQANFPEEWLLAMEILEIADNSNGLASEIKDYLLNLKSRKPEFSMLINNGFNLIEKKD